MEDLKMDIQDAMPLASVPFGHGLNCEDISRLIDFLNLLQELGAPASVNEFVEPQVSMLKKALKNCLAAWCKENRPGMNALGYGNLSAMPKAVQEIIKKKQHANDN